MHVQKERKERQKETETQAMTEKPHNEGMQKKECMSSHLKINIRHCSRP